MPLYVNRWSNMTLSIVEAADEDAFLSMMDDLYGASQIQQLSFKVLENPFVLTLDLKPQFLANRHYADTEHTSLIKLRQDQIDLLNDEEYKDLTVDIGGEEVTCHKAVLARCEYFKKMLSSKMSEVKQNKLVLQGTTVRIFKYVLEYLYCRDMTFSSEEDLDTLLDLLRYTHMLDIEEAVCLAASKIENLLLAILTEYKNKNDSSQQSVLQFSDIVERVRKVKNLCQVLSISHLQHTCEDVLNELKPKHMALDGHGSEMCSNDPEFEARLREMLQMPPASLNVVEIEKLLETKSHGDFKTLSFSPHFVVTVKAIQKDETAREKYIDVLHLLSKYEIPIDQAVGLNVSDLAGCKFKVNCTALLAACATGSVQLIDSLLKLGADPLYPVTSSGRTVIHLIDNLAADDKNLMPITQKLLKSTEYAHVLDIPFHEPKNFPDIDDFYVRHVIEEFTCPMSERGQAIEFSLALDNASDPERLIVNELRKMVLPKLQSVWIQNTHDSIKKSLSSGKGNIDSVDRKSLCREVRSAIYEDYRRACQYDHPKAYNEEVALVLSIEDLQRACSSEER